MLPVYFETYPVGEVRSDEAGPHFAYAPAWQTLRGAFPVSLTMPLDRRDVAPDTFAPWAANLLPEAAQLIAVGRHLGVAPADIVGLLSQIGRDTAGALSFGAPGGTDPDQWRPIESEAALERIIDELPRKPFLVGEDGISMSLAGVQTKIAVAADASGTLYIPLNGSPSTHILKPDADRLWGSVENEAFCLTLARRCGLAVPGFTTGAAGRRRYLLVDRYDRRREDRQWRRLHQEDFCQALGKPPSAKYERNQTGVPGPTLAQMIELTRRRMSAADVLAMLDLAIFNILACNTDAHAKNYAILLGARAAALAPAFDIMCAEPYEGITRNLAQTIAGKNRGEHLRRRHWERFFREAKLGVAPSLQRVRRLAEATLTQAATARGEVEALGGTAPQMLAACEESVTRRARAILAGLEDDGNAPDEGEGETPPEEHVSAPH
ncbi:MAG TPA: HipA domain-containing protein [Allosphingosinicella sp.]|jgi:serine/threonine-protein kinase HipA|nr:HipA domain-containing protein [Allosphingosinicella sp.]